MTMTQPTTAPAEGQAGWIDPVRAAGDTKYTAKFGSVDTSGPVPAASLNTPAPNLPPPVSNTSAQSALGATVDGHADAVSTAQQQAAEQAKTTPAPDATSPNPDLKSTLSSILGLSNQLGTEGARTIAIQQQEGVDTKKKQLDQIDQQILSRTRAYDKQIQGIHSQPGILADAATAKESEVTRQKNSELADLSIQRYAAAGDYQTAYDIADKKVKAEFEPIKNQLDTLKTYYQLSQNDMTDSEKMKAQSAITQKEDEAKALLNAKTDALKNAATQQAPADVLTGIANATTLGDLYKTGGKYITDPYGGKTQVITMPDGTMALIDSATGNTIKTFDGTESQGSSDPVSAASQAILGNESAGNYDAKSPILPSGSNKGDRSYGKYQVLGANIPSWTKQYFGQSMTPQQFLASPEAQEAVQKGKMQDLWNQYGNIKDVASVYFSGVPYAQAVKEGRKDQATGMTVQAYVAKAEGRFNQLATSGNSTPSTSTNVPPALKPYLKTSYSGIPYVDLADLTPKEKSQYAQVAQRNGIQALLNSGDAGKISAIADAKTNLDAIQSSLELDGKNPLVGGQGFSQVLRGIGNATIGKLTDSRVKSFNAWRTAIINNVQALAGGQGSGLRINKAEIDAAMANDLPVITGPNADSAESARGKLAILNKQLDTWEKQLLGGGNVAPGAGPQSGGSNDPLGIL